MCCRFAFWNFLLAFVTGLSQISSFFSSTNVNIPLLKHCILINKVVRTILRVLSKILQRRYGPDPRPLLLLVGIPKALGPEFSYRLRVSQTTLTDVTIYF